jgi:hypothetical protein
MITDTDHGYKKLLVNVRKMRKTTVKVGVDDKPHPGRSGLTTAEIGAIHEFGLGVPQRSFLRGWVDGHQREWFSWLRQGLVRALVGDAKWADDYGKYAVKGVQERILAHIPPPLADSTVERKGGETTPLLDTGELLQDIIYEVER